MPASLAALIDDASITIIAAIVILVEIVVLWLFARNRRGTPFASYLANGLSGLSLILALRAALLDTGAGAVAFWLGLGLLAHLGDLAVRLGQTRS